VPGAPHALVVGASGMLAGVVLHLAGEGHRVSAVARRPAPLEALVRRAGEMGGGVRALPLDYRDGPALRDALDRASGEWGPIRLAVCWIHSVAPEAAWTVAQVMEGDGGEGRPRLLHLLGSAGDDPRRPRPELDRRRARFPGVDYQQVILGYTVEDGRSRWLTDEEIVDGVVRAIRRPEARTVIGTLEPWSGRP
jgi:hypothetical protein